MWDPYGVCNLLGKFRLPGLLMGVPPGVFCPEFNPPIALAEELELVDELELVESAPPEKVGIPRVGESTGHGGAEACGGVPCPLPGPVDVILN